MESKSVTVATLAVCQKYVGRFWDASRRRELRLDTADQVDLALVKELDGRFFYGAPLNNGQYLVAAWQSVHPRCGKHGDLNLPRAKQCLRG